MRLKASICLGFACAFWGYTRLVWAGNQWAISIIGIILTASAIALFFNKFFSKNPSFKWVEKCTAFLDKLNLEYTIIGLGFLALAIGFLIPGTIWAGVIFAIIAAAFLLAEQIPVVKSFLDKYLP